MEIMVPSLPKRWRITQTMMEDFICDPVLAAKVILKLDWDVFQKVRMRYYWWVPKGEDSSGFSSGKTIVDWAYLVLRCILIEDHRAAVFYPTFETGKKEFWQYFQRIQAPIYRAHLANVDDRGKEKAKSRRETGSCFYAHFRNASQLLMPAGDFVRDSNNQSSLRLNTLMAEEWPHMDAAGDGISKQLLGRVTRESWNQYHPVWTNHIHLTAPAQDSVHPGYPRHRQMERDAKSGNPHWFYIRFCFKDYSDLPSENGVSFKDRFRVQSTIDAVRAGMSEEKFMCEGLGIWGVSALAIYSGEALERAVQIGRQRKIRPMLKAGRKDREDARVEVAYFLGVDPAPAMGDKSDDGAMVVLRAERQLREDESPSGESEAGVPMQVQPEDYALSLVYGRRLRNISTSQWSGIIHGLHKRFGFSRIAMDWNGGGNFITLDLRKPHQTIDNQNRFVRPIAAPDDVTVSDGQFILINVKRGDPGIDSLWPEMAGDDVLVDAQHTQAMAMVNGGQIAFPPPWQELQLGMNEQERQTIPQELMWAGRTVDELIEQLKGMGVETTKDGTLVTSKHGARKFVARGKKDFVSAFLNAITAFLCYLESGEGDEAENNEEVFSPM